MTKPSAAVNRVVIGALVAGAACAALLLGAAASASAGTLDQQQALVGDPVASHSIYDDDGMGGNGQSVAQTFTAGITGELDQVDLYLQKFGAPAADLTVQIYDTVLGAPVNVLATESVAAASVPDVPNYSFVPVTFDPTVPVTAGTQYAIVAWTATQSGAPYYWTHLDGNPYAAGEPRIQLGPTASPPGPVWGPSGATIDKTFKTYVIPSPAGSPPGTPPPGTLPGTAPPTSAAASQTGQRAAALKRCKKKRGKARKKCKQRALKLPV